MSSTDRRTDGQTDRRTRWIQYTPPPTSLGGGIMMTQSSDESPGLNELKSCLLPLWPAKRSPDVFSNYYNAGNWWPGAAVNTLRPRQNGCHFQDDILKWIFLNENAWITIKISLTLVLRGLINNIPALVQMMAWHRPGDKPLSEPMMVVYWRKYAFLGLNELRVLPFHVLQAVCGREEGTLCIGERAWGERAQLKTIDVQRAEDLGESTGFVFEASLVTSAKWRRIYMFSPLFIMLFIQQPFGISTWNLNTAISLIYILMG